MSSKRRLRWRSCLRKIKHSKEFKATEHAKDLGKPYRAYKCRFCGGWHVGRPYGRIIQSIKQKAHNARSEMT